MRDLETDKELAARGLKRVVKYACIFWDEKGGWHSCLTDREQDAKGYGGFGDFAGYNKVTCIVPINA